MNKLHSRAGENLMAIRCGIVGCRTSANRRCSMRSRARRSRRRIIRSARSTRTSASWPCPTRGSRSWRRSCIRRRFCRRRSSSSTSPASSPAPRKGEGLGNKFLAHIREVDAIAHVVRCFENDDIIHVAGKIDPASDIDVINTELALADLDSVERAYQKALQSREGRRQGGDPLRDLLERVRAAIESRRSRCAPSGSTRTSRRACATCIC